MKSQELALYLEKLEATTSRNEITEILAEVLKRASVSEIDKICYLSLGRLVPLFEPLEFNIAEKMMLSILSRAYSENLEKLKNFYKRTGDLGEVATALSQKLKIKSQKLAVEEVYRALYKIATLTGVGSVERKTETFANLLKRLDFLSAKYVTRIPLGKLRLGFSDVTILDALSWMETGDKSLRGDLECAYNVSADIGKIARIFKKEGLKGLGRVKAEVGTPIRTAQAERLPSAEAVVEKLGKFAVEAKYDGFRVQIHLDTTKRYDLSEAETIVEEDVFGKFASSANGGFGKKNERPFVRIFSRNLENITRMFPDVVEAVQKLKIKKAIFDGEAIAYNPDTEEFLPFQETVQRKRKYGISEKVKEVPLKVFVYDLLYFENKALLNKPFSERRKILNRILKEDAKQTLILTHQDIVSDVEALKKVFDLYVSEGLEGVMCKKLDSEYQAGARNLNWVKYKRAIEGELADTIDGVVMGYYRGRGRRAGFGIGAFLVGVLAETRDKFVTIAKVGTGVKDDEWYQLKEIFDKNKASIKPEEYEVDKLLNCDVWVKPKIVVVVKADEITRSPVHTAGKTGEAGYALRFPRLVEIRADKNPEDATTVEEVVRLYGFQNSKFK